MARAVAEVITPSNLDGLPDGTTRKAMSDTEKTKLSGIEDGATSDQSGSEIQSAILGLADTDRQIMASDPQSGEHKIYGAHRNAAGNLEYDYEDQAEP